MSGTSRSFHHLDSDAVGGFNDLLSAFELAADHALHVYDPQSPVLVMIDEGEINLRGTDYYTVDDEVEFAVAL
ncbi:hypothetical protein D3C71_2006860 [compost metagenome]